jgi:hypothetical protein
MKAVQREVQSSMTIWEISVFQAYTRAFDLGLFGNMTENTWAMHKLNLRALELVNQLLVNISSQTGME